MQYVDGFITPVPTDKRDAYQAFAEKNATMFKSVGALNVIECWEDDVPAGVNTSFPLAVKKLESESVALSWIIWPSKDVRDAGWAKIMSDLMMREETPPFDGSRLIYGGFQMIVNA